MHTSTKEIRTMKLQRSSLKIRNREIRPAPEISALSLIELEILLKSGVVKMKGRALTDQDIAEYFEELCEGLRIYSIPINSITCESLRLSAWIRAKYNLSYYDSHYAAQAQLHDQQIISADKACQLPTDESDGLAGES